MMDGFYPGIEQESQTTLTGTSGISITLIKLGRIVTMVCNSTPTAAIAAWTEIATVPAAYLPKSHCYFNNAYSAGYAFSLDKDSGAIRPNGALSASVPVWFTVSYISKS